MRVSVIPVICCLAAGFAQAMQSGHDALNNLLAATTKLDNTVANWDGGPFTLFPLGMQAHSLVSQVNAATQVFQGLTRRTEQDDKAILASAQLARDGLDHILKTVVASKAKFEKIPLGVPIMFGVLKSLQLPTNKMASTVVVGATPASGPALQKLQGEVKQLFTQTMNAFE